jgi:hypothetical protein
LATNEDFFMATDTNCYAHATETDREHYREREKSVAAQGEEYQARKAVMVEFGRAVMFGWADAHDEAAQPPSPPVSHRTRTTSSK